MPSIRDVAKRANVSISTVSRVITKSAPVDEATKERVVSAISEIGYRPNIIAQSLRSKSGQMIGLLVPGLGNPSFTRLIDSLAGAANSHGLGLIIADTKNDQKQESEAIDMMLRRNVDGIILSRVSDKSQVVRQFMKNKQNSIPLVVIDRALAHEGIPNVVADNYGSGLLAGRHLVSIGCRKIACVCGPRVISLVRDRISGFADALKENGTTLEESMIFEGDFTFDSGIKMVEQILSNHIEVDGIWCHDDIIALGVLSALQRRGVHVPGDIALMGMDDIQYSRMSYPTLTTIAQPFTEMSEKVIELIESIKNGQNPEKKHIVLNVNLVKRESTAR